MYGIPRRSGRYRWEKTPITVRIKHKFWIIWGKFLRKIGYSK